MVTLSARIGDIHSLNIIEVKITLPKNLKFDLDEENPL
jgi:hypothetical protein